MFPLITVLSDSAFDLLEKVNVYVVEFRAVNFGGVFTRLGSSSSEKVVENDCPETRGSALVASIVMLYTPAKAWSSEPTVNSSVVSSNVSRLAGTIPPSASLVE